MTIKEEQIIKTCKLYLEELNEVLRTNETISEKEFTNKYSPQFRAVFSIHTDLDESFSFYRTRIVNEEKEDIKQVSTFSYFPINLAKGGKPKIGRFNSTGQPVFYSSLSAETNLQEIKGDIKEGDYVFISKWNVRKGKNINCYNIIPSQNIYAGDTKKDEIVMTNEDVVNNILGDYLRCVGDLCLQNNFEDDRKYYISTLFANHVFKFRTDDGLLYEGIIYPSVAVNKPKAYYTNMAFTPTCVDEKLFLQWVLKAKVGKNLKELTPVKYGFNVDNTIRWLKLNFEIDYSSFSIVGFYNEDGEFLFEKFPKTEEQLIKVNNLRETLLNDFRKIAISKLEEETQVERIPFPFDQMVNMLNGNAVSFKGQLGISDGYFKKFKYAIKGKPMSNGGILFKCGVKIKPFFA